MPLIISTGLAQELPPPPPPGQDCSCSDYVSNTGFGNCQKIFKKSPICYVNEPSTCTDLVKSTLTGKQYSWEACTLPPPPLPSRPPLTPPDVDSVGCSCSDYISDSGFGNCKKLYKSGPICYVNVPSTCSDLKKSKSAGRSYSWDACAPPPPPPRKRSNLQPPNVGNYCNKIFKSTKILVISSQCLIFILLYINKRCHS